MIASGVLNFHKEMAIVLTQDSMVVLLLQPLWSDEEFSYIVVVNLSSLRWWARVLMVIRALRPLQIISVVPHLRQVISELLEGWPHLLQGIIIMLGFMYMFASLGLQVQSTPTLCHTHLIPYNVLHTPHSMHTVLVMLGILVAFCWHYNQPSSVL